MTAHAQVAEPTSLIPPQLLQDPTSVLHEIAIRLADEGIPVRAIARSVRLASADIYEVLRDALAAGSIVEMPRDDWPVGTRRSARTAFNGTPLENDDALKMACVRFFKVTRLEAAILSVLLKRSEVTKTQLHLVVEQNRPSEGREETDIKMVDVIICHLRKKLSRHGIKIETIWGIGYLVSPAQREYAQRLLTDYSSAEGAPHG